MQLEVKQVHPAPLVAPKNSQQDAGKGKKTEAVNGKAKGQDKKKDSSNPTEKASDAAVFQPDQSADPGVPKTKA